MPNVRIPQSVTKRTVLKAFLSSDHLSAATGKTIAVVLSQNGGAFANPSGGATNATEIASGWYYVDLSTTDTGTLGPLIIRGTSSGVDDVEIVLEVANAHNQGFDGIPNAAAAASNGLLTSGTGSNQFTTSSGQVTVATNNDKTGYTASTVSDKAGYSLATAQIPIRKNTALAAFPFAMFTSGGVPATGLTITATRSIDGAAFASCANSATEIANGWYTISLAAADVNGSAIALRFSSAGAVDTDITLLTQ